MSRRGSFHLAGLMLAFTAAALIWTLVSRAAPAALTRDDLATHFDAGIRNLVIAWDPNDARPEAERRQALFDFMYETYQASAWIPQSLFDSNLVTHAVAGDVDTIISEKVGLVRWRDNPLVPAYGMAPNAQGAPSLERQAPSAERQPLNPERPAPNAERQALNLERPAPSAERQQESLKWTVNCLVCHMAEIDGVAYFGAGTKTFDEFWLGEALKRLTSDPWRALVPRASGDQALAADANRILNSHHHDKIDSLTRARSTAFAASHVEMYMRSHNSTMPSVEDVGRGDVKTPPLWHTAAKMSVGRWYTDGSFHGPYPLMASSMELEKDRPFDALVHVVIPTIRTEFETVVRHLRPPPYPYEIDWALAARGRELFNSRAIGCAQCHGVYDGRGNVDWPGEHTDVGTDRSRLGVVSDGFIDAFNRSPLSSGGQLKKSRAYAATPLTGVWANFPYLHNGSVPTLYHLLGPASERPAIFQVMAARKLDRDRLGQPLYVDPSLAALGEAELIRRFGHDRNWYYSGRPGSGNMGHDLWSRIRTDENRRALIEYLKTL